MRFPLLKQKRYPIQRNEQGQSLRQQAFELFEKKLRPMEICQQQLLSAKPATLLRYFEDWKRRGRHISYREVRQLMKSSPDIREQVLQSLAKHLEMSIEEVQERMAKPWGLKQALRGQWPNYREEEIIKKKQSAVEARLDGGIWFMRLGEKFKNSPGELADLLLELVTLQENVTLEITKKDRHLMYKREESGERKNIKSFDENTNINERPI